MPSSPETKLEIRYPWETTPIEKYPSSGSGKTIEESALAKAPMDEEEEAFDREENPNITALGEENFEDEEEKEIPESEKVKSEIAEGLAGTNNNSQLATNNLQHETLDTEHGTQNVGQEIQNTEPDTPVISPPSLGATGVHIDALNKVTADEEEEEVEMETDIIKELGNSIIKSIKMNESMETTVREILTIKNKYAA